MPKDEKRKQLKSPMRKALQMQKKTLTLLSHGKTPSKEYRKLIEVNTQAKALMGCVSNLAKKYLIQKSNE